MLKRDKEILFLKDCIVTAEREKYPEHMRKYYGEALLKAERDRDIFLKINKRWLQ